jgi:hypothetical protein
MEETLLQDLHVDVKENLGQGNKLSGNGIRDLGDSDYGKGESTS